MRVPVPGEREVPGAARLPGPAVVADVPLVQHLRPAHPLGDGDAQAQPGDGEHGVRLGAPGQGRGAVRTPGPVGGAGPSGPRGEGHAGTAGRAAVTGGRTAVPAGRRGTAPLPLPCRHLPLGPAPGLPVGPPHLVGDEQQEDQPGRHERLAHAPQHPPAPGAPAPIAVPYDPHARHSPHPRHLHRSRPHDGRSASNWPGTGRCPSRSRRRRCRRSRSTASPCDGSGHDRGRASW